MLIDILQFVLKHKPPRPEYDTYYTQDKSDGVVHTSQIFGILIIIICTKFSFIRLVGKKAHQLAADRGKDAAHRDGVKLIEEAWVLAGNICMLVSALNVMMHHNGGCTFANTDSCLAGWPTQKVVSAAAWYYALEFAWYLHLLLKPVFKYGPQDGRDMMIHHFASLTLIVLSYGFAITRIGVLTLSLFGISNPFLHLAKICNQLDIKNVKIPVFALFALVFFITRVIMVPPVILYTSVIKAQTQIPYALVDFFPVWLTLIGLLCVLYVLQLVWMWSIVRVLRHAAVDGADAASKLSAQVDPAKRYANGEGTTVTETQTKTNRKTE